MKQRVHVVFTGGTIGSCIVKGITDLSTQPARQLLSLPISHDVTFSQSEPFQILSEDATLANWSDLARHIASLNSVSLDAIIVAHGSDTLAWTGYALAYALAGFTVPIVLVASDKPLTDPTANGPDNFCDAIAFALTEKLPGVYVAWKNRGEATTIHLATRMLPCDLHNDKFRSVCGLHFGTVSQDGFRRNTVEGNPSRSHLAKMANKDTWAVSALRLQNKASFEPNVLVLPAMPGIDHTHLDPSNWKAVLQVPYHSGTVCSPSYPGSFTEFAHRCRELEIPVLIGPRRGGSATYASSQRLDDLKLCFAPSMSEFALVVKIRWMVGTGQDLSRISESIAFDLLPEVNFPS